MRWQHEPYLINAPRSVGGILVPPPLRLLSRTRRWLNCSDNGYCSEWCPRDRTRFPESAECLMTEGSWLRAIVPCVGGAHPRDPMRMLLRVLASCDSDDGTPGDVRGGRALVCRVERCGIPQASQQAARSTPRPPLSYRPHETLPFAGASALIRIQQPTPELQQGRHAVQRHAGQQGGRRRDATADETPSARGAGGR